MANSDRPSPARRAPLVSGAAVFLAAQACVGFAAETTDVAESYNKQVAPLLKKHCVRCHNAEKLTSGVRVDHLDATLDDRHLKLWKHVRRQLRDETMPPEDEPQPTADERRLAVEWIERGLEVARSRPTPKNGTVRRLTVAQYRNTLRELLLLDDNLTDILPPDAVSRDGFVNNQETLALSPLLMEAYIQIAEQALDRSIVDVNAKPAIQNFRVDLGAGVNPEPCRDKLDIGAFNQLLNNADVLVTQLTPKKDFEFQPFFMRTKYRFIEGYQGNDTVRGWRDFDSIYHAVFACMRGPTATRKAAPGARFRRGCCSVRRSRAPRSSRSKAPTDRGRTSRSRSANCPTTGGSE